MTRRSGIGRGSDDFNFNKSQPPKIQKLQQLRPSDRTSFYLRPDKTLYLKDPCDGLHINDIPDLLKKGGRQEGTIVEYDPVQRKNYLSVSARYERSLDLILLSIQKRGNSIFYLFCSSGSPTGYWEVEVVSGATYLIFTNPILTIICPRPFRLQDFTGVETDGEFIAWEQLQGRIAIISPLTGEGSLNPYISIIGTPKDTDPPILIKGDAEADPTVTDTLLIYTSPTSNYSGQAFNSTGEVIGDCYFPKPHLVPLTLQSAYKYDGRSLLLTWLNPQCDGQYAVGYKLLRNTTGEYLSVAELSAIANRVLEVEPNTHYRLETIFEVNKKQISKFSNLIYFPYSENSIVENIFGDDSIAGLAFQSVGSSYSKTINQVVNYNFDDSYTPLLSFASTKVSYLKINLTRQIQYMEENYSDRLSFAFVENKISKVNLGGVIIG